jgi:hypothetical protein
MSGERESSRLIKPIHILLSKFLETIVQCRSIVPAFHLQQLGVAASPLDTLYISGTIDLYNNDRNNMSGERDSNRLIKRIHMPFSNFLGDSGAA